MFIMQVPISEASLPVADSTFQGFGLETGEWRERKRKRESKETERDREREREERDRARQ